jgi:hypothetical protein
MPLLVNLTGLRCPASPRELRARRNLRREISIIFGRPGQFWLAASKRKDSLAVPVLHCSPSFHVSHYVLVQALAITAVCTAAGGGQPSGSRIPLCSRTRETATHTMAQRYPRRPNGFGTRPLSLRLLHPLTLVLWPALSVSLCLGRRERETVRVAESKRTLCALQFIEERFTRWRG